MAAIKTEDPKHQPNMTKTVVSLHTGRQNSNTRKAHSFQMEEGVEDAFIMDFVDAASNVANICWGVGPNNAWVAEYQGKGAEMEALRPSREPLEKPKVTAWIEEALADHFDGKRKPCESNEDARIRATHQEPHDKDGDGSLIPF